MPLFDFSCVSCGQHFEFLVRGKDWTAEVHCPDCGQAKMENLKKLPARAGGIRVAAAASNGSCSGNPSSCGRCGTN